MALAQEMLPSRFHHIKVVFANRSLENVFWLF
jgi:hypothetical protein